MTYITHNLCLSYGNKIILRDINISLAGGQFSALLGCNGAGKSTLLKVLAGDLEPSSGEVLLFGKALHRYSAAALAQHRAVLTQKPSLSFAFRVYQVVEMGLANTRLKRAQRDKQVSLMLRLTGTEHLAHRDYTSLSGGEQQRVHFARILAQLWFTETDKPPILLLDEPVSALDLAWQQRVLEIAQWLAKFQHWTVLAVLHDMNQAAAYADTVYLLDDGICLANGTPRETLSSDNLNRAFSVQAHVQDHPIAPERPQIVPIKADLPAIDELLLYEA